MHSSSPQPLLSSLSWWTSAGTACYHEPKVHDYELYFQLNRITLFVLLPLALLGLLSNTCALVCLCTPPKISSGVFIYLKALLVLDHCHIIVSLVNTLFPDFCDSHHSREHIAYGFCMFERRFLRAMVPRLDLMVDTLHVWTIASLAAHRYWKISRPVVSRFKDTVSRARSLMAVLFVAITFYRLPTFMVELQIKWQPVFRIQRRPETTEMLSPYRIWLYSVVDPIVSHLVPFVLMCVFSLLTLCEIVKSRHFAYAQFSIACDSHGTTMKRRRSSGSSHPLRRRTDGARQKQEYRATLSIFLIILLYLVLHSMELYILVRKWQLLAQDNCPTRADYIQSHISKILSVLSASVNAFVFIAFTNRMRTYIQMLIRRTSRSLSSNSSEPPAAHKISETRITVPLIDV
uniref:G_PROTEIN_RECEP_F1_2 domain-containing protein n=1 Tax=Globodera pallida TaxID=36090 RepID=A0A183BIX5_GLOPA